MGQNEVFLKTHLIVTDIHEEYYVDWCGCLDNTIPLFKNNMPIFIIISSKGRVELNTFNISELEKCAKRLTHPKGRGAVTIDKSYIYVKEINGNETLVGIVTHRHVKTFAPMYDKINIK